MRVIRKAAVSGSFYPDDPTQLRQAVNTFLASISTKQNPATSPPKALIVPHAGYMYSGSTAARAFATIQPAHRHIKRVVLLGPSHRVGFQGIAFCSSDYFNTPLGTVPVDHSAFATISTIPGVVLLDQAHAEEHSLEVQLPFLQSILDDFSVVPLVVGDIDAAQVAKVIEKLWGSNETLIIVSSDLSHFLTYDEANALDQQTCCAVEQLNPEAIGYEQACGRTPMKGLLELARDKALKVDTIELCNSGDTAGDRNRVVGYGAWAFYE